MFPFFLATILALWGLLIVIFFTRPPIDGYVRPRARPTRGIDRATAIARERYGYFICISIRAYEFVESLPRVSVLDLQAEDSFCCLCHAEFFRPQMVTTDDRKTDSLRRIRCVPVELPCGHIMGNKCLRNWVDTCMSDNKGHGTCPLCRDVILLSLDPDAIY